MIPSNIKRIHLARYPIDFRKNHQGLLVEALSMKLEILNGDALVFLNKSKTGLKILVADDTGLWVLYKKMSSGTIKSAIDNWQSKSTKSISQGELMMIAEGNKYEIIKKSKKWLR